MKKLEQKDFEKAAAVLRCQVAAVCAVAEVESKGDGFYDDGFPVILFERHKFYKYTNGRFARSHAEICNSVAGGYGKAGQNQRRKFNLAFSLDAEAAMLSCSWGKFQVMGFNYAICGFNSVGEFVDAMKKSEGEHLLAFCRYVKANGLDRHLRSLNWAAFARGYNGEDYRKNNYDRKMADAFKKFQSAKTLADLPEVTAENQNTAVNQTSQNSDGDGETDGNSKLKEYADKYLKHCKTDSAKNIFLVISARIGTAITTLWTLGVTGKIFLIIISAVIIGSFIYALIYYRGRFFGWIKTLLDSLLNQS